MVDCGLAKEKGCKMAATGHGMSGWPVDSAGVTRPRTESFVVDKLVQIEQHVKNNILKWIAKIYFFFSEFY